MYACRYARRYIWMCVCWCMYVYINAHTVTTSKRTAANRQTDERAWLCVCVSVCLHVYLIQLLAQRSCLWHSHAQASTYVDVELVAAVLLPLSYSGDDRYFSNKWHAGILKVCLHMLLLAVSRMCMHVSMWYVCIGNNVRLYCASVTAYKYLHSASEYRVLSELSIRFRHSLQLRCACRTIVHLVVSSKHIMGWECGNPNSRHLWQRLKHQHKEQSRGLGNQYRVSGCIVIPLWYGAPQNNITIETIIQSSALPRALCDETSNP